MENQKFSDQLELWLKSDSKKTIKNLEEFFLDKSFAIGILILMALPALPIPTGGVSHVFEALAACLTAGIIVGLDKIWLPKKWENTPISGKREIKLIEGLLRFVRFFEKFSRKRGTLFITNWIIKRFIGFATLIFIGFAFFAPPFSGLDTFPALGVVIMMLSLILGDLILLIIGLLIGSFGVGLIIFLGEAAFQIIKNLIF